MDSPLFTFHRRGRSINMELACILLLVASVSARPQQQDDIKPLQCSDFESQGYSCVNFQTCDGLTKEIITDGSGNIDIRKGIQNNFWCSLTHDSPFYLIPLLTLPLPKDPSIPISSYPADIMSAHSCLASGLVKFAPAHA